MRRGRKPKGKEVAAAILCGFDAADHLKGKARTYEAVKEAVVAAGKYSVFEATATPKDARLFTRLDNDPELEITRPQGGFPWIKVRKKLPDCSGCVGGDPTDIGRTHQAGTKQHPEGA